MAFFEKTKVANANNDTVNPSTEDTSLDSGFTLRKILMVLLAPLGYDKSLQRYRQTAVIESGSVGITNIGGQPGQMLLNHQNHSAWAQCVRSRIT